MKNWKDNIHFLLVEPKEPGNIGSAARAIKNMGFKKLGLVNPQTEITDEARWRACNSLDVLNSAGIFPDLKSSIRDMAVVVGTSRRTGKRRGAIFPVEEGVKGIFELARENKVAILFGREDSGLFNEEVDECGMLLTIPTGREHRSLNLSHAVLIVAYELLKAGYASVPIKSSRTESFEQSGRILTSSKLVSHENLSALYKRMSDTLKLLEYIPRGNRNLEAKIMQNLKHFISRAGLTDWELKMMHGICTQVGKKLNRPDD